MNQEILNYYKSELEGLEIDLINAKNDNQRDFLNNQINWYEMKIQELI